MLGYLISWCVSCLFFIFFYDSSVWSVNFTLLNLTSWTEIPSFSVFALSMALDDWWRRGHNYKILLYTSTCKTILLLYTVTATEIPTHRQSSTLWHGVMLELLDKFYPELETTLTSSDPPYVTPTVKALLRRKNRLMRAGRRDCRAYSHHHTYRLCVLL